MNICLDFLYICGLLNSLIRITIIHNGTYSIMLCAVVLGMR
jgi:hypothetical protein